MAFVGTLECFDNSKSDIETYIERFEQLVNVNSIDDEKKLTLLETFIGAEAYSTLKNLCTPDSPVDKTYKQVTDVLKSYYNPKKIVVFERFRFHKREQHSGETIASYAVELKRLARSCKFDAFLDDALRDRLICGLKNEAIQKRLLSESSELKFDDVYGKAVSMELAFLESKTIIDSGTDIAKIGTNIKKSVSHDETKYKTINKCGQCGRPHGKFCPARNWTCFLCFKKGHAKKMCPNNTKMNSVDEEGDFFESLNFLNGIHNVNSKSEIVQVLINNVPVDMEIDTGAAVTVISSAVFYKKFPNLSLTRVAKQYTVANGGTLDVVGMVLVSVKFGLKEVKLEMFVFRGAYKMPLFGRPWLDQLLPSWRDRFREIMCGDEVKFLSEDLADNPLVEFKREYPLVFSEEPTAMKGFKATIVLKEGAKPVFCKPYSVPYAIKPLVEVELKKMVETGVLVPVKHSNWASPIVVVPKKDKSLRICVDFKVSVNKWVDFHHYPLPNIDDILASLSGCTCFTVLDLAGAYQQVEIAKDSMELFTINTHLGLFRFTRLTYGISSAPTIFQQLMDEILRGLPKTVCYLDDILVAGADLEECRANVNAVFDRLVRYNVHVNEKKCFFFRRKVE